MAEIHYCKTDTRAVCLFNVLLRLKEGSYSVHCYQLGVHRYSGSFEIF